MLRFALTFKIAHFFWPANGALANVGSRTRFATSGGPTAFHGGWSCFRVLYNDLRSESITYLKIGMKTLQFVIKFIGHNRSRMFQWLKGPNHLWCHAHMVHLWNIWPRRPCCSWRSSYAEVCEQWRCEDGEKLWNRNAHHWMSHTFTATLQVQQNHGGIISHYIFAH